MADAKKCDRCHDYYTMAEWYDKAKEINKKEYLMLYRSKRANIDYIERIYDLCPACQNKLTDFMNLYDRLV